MSYLKIVIISIYVVFSSLCFAQAQQLSGSKSAYQYDLHPSLSPAPVGYQAFYIDHVGRHGSRFISSPKSEELVYHILLLAEKKQQLTKEGISLLIQVKQIIALNRGNYGQLTDLGGRDIYQIGQRMLVNNPTVFKGNRIEVISSTVPRAINTAEIFVQPFKDKYQPIDIKQQTENEQTLLRFFEYSPAYQQYKQSDTIKGYEKSIKDTAKTQMMSKQIAQKIFNDDFINRLEHGIKGLNKAHIKTNDFVIALYALNQELLSFSPQTLSDNHLDFSGFFSAQQNDWFATILTLKNYLQIGPGLNSNGIQIKIAAPLLWDLLHTADNAIIHNDIDANLRFAHAETVSPLATLLELEGTATVADTLVDYPHVWKADQIIPMAANIQFIFYRAQQTNLPILVKVLLNEREVHLPIKTDTYPYYRWQDVKQFYINKLNILGLSDTQPTLELLKNIQ